MADYHAIQSDEEVGINGHSNRPSRNEGCRIGNMLLRNHINLPTNLAWNQDSCCYGLCNVRRVWRRGLTGTERRMTIFSRAGAVQVPDQ